MISDHLKMSFKQKCIFYNFYSYNKLFINFTIVLQATLKTLFQTQAASAASRKSVDYTPNSSYDTCTIQNKVCENLLLYIFKNEISRKK